MLAYLILIAVFSAGFGFLSYGIWDSVKKHKTIQTSTAQVVEPKKKLGLHLSEIACKNEEMNSVSQIDGLRDFFLDWEGMHGNYSNHRSSKHTTKGEKGNNIHYPDGIFHGHIEVNYHNPSDCHCEKIRLICAKVDELHEEYEKMESEMLMQKHDPDAILNRLTMDVEAVRSMTTKAIESRDAQNAL